MAAKINYKVSPVKRVLAIKTLEAIDTALSKDRGSTFRRILRQTISKAEDAYREDNDIFRTHLGASQIGRECARELWYTFRWALARNFGNKHGIKTGDERLRTAGRYIRLLNRGHLEEARFVALLLMIGVKIWQYDENGNQFIISLLGGHYGGAGDSIALGIPDCPDIPLLVEMKTHNDASFSKLENEGLRESKYEHWCQMQTYLGGYKLRGGLYLAVNKDTDFLYGELVGYEPEAFAYQEDRAKKIILSVIPPQRISQSPAWYKCKMCDFRHICHSTLDELGNLVSQEINCRTCIYSRPILEGGWICDYHKKPLSKTDQLVGCGNYKPMDM